MRRFASLAVAAVVCTVTQGMVGHCADVPAPDLDNVTWTLRCNDFFAAGKPLNIYASRRSGVWTAALATSRLWNQGNHYGWNLGRYVCDMSKVQVTGDRFQGTIQLTLTPDPWVPADHKPRTAVVEVDGQLAAPDATPQAPLRSVEGAYKAHLSAGIREQAADIRGDIAGGIKPTQPNKLDDVSYVLTFRNLYDASDLYLKLGLNEGKIASAVAARVSFNGTPTDLRSLDVAQSVTIDAERIGGEFTIPETSLDGAENLPVEVSFHGCRVGDFVASTYTARIRKPGGGEKVIQNCCDGNVTPGVFTGKIEPDMRAWLVPVKDWRSPQPGEHPRLLFRRSDLARLRARAKTPEGQAVLDRLRQCLNGSDGQSMPTAFNPEKGPVSADGPGEFFATAPLGAYTFTHIVGYGLLYQLTGDKKYADLGRQCFEKALEGYRDVDRRYAFKAPFHALRAGPSLGWTAVGYDLCYDGWDEDFRRRVAREIANYDEHVDNQRLTLETLVAGTMPPASNHFGMQVGGAALALLAVDKDPGVDQKKIDELLPISQASMVRNLSQGFGDGGFFAEGDGTGSMSSHIAFLTSLQAWRIAGGKDFTRPRPNASWTALKWIFLTVPRAAQMDFWPQRGAYPHNIWAREDKSGAGYFAIAFGALGSEQQSALLWFYNHHLKESDAERGTPFDTTCRYPHLAVCAFVNWPWDLAEKNPAQVLPRCYRDSRWSFYAFRNRWQDENDVVISVLTQASRGYMQARADGGLHVTGLGKRFEWVKLSGPASYWRPEADGSGILTLEDGTSLAVDFSQASGAEAMLVTTGSADGTRIVLGGKTLTFKFLSSAAQPVPTLKDDRVVVGRQTVRLEGGNIELDTRNTAQATAN